MRALLMLIAITPPLMPPPLFSLFHYYFADDDLFICQDADFRYDAFFHCHYAMMPPMLMLMPMPFIADYLLMPFYLLLRHYYYCCHFLRLRRG